jgi:DNA modification methylase
MLEIDTILCGDALVTLKTLPDGVAHTCVTSPPYWNLRDYHVAGQIGLEPTIEEYVATLVQVFREVRRVLRPDGTLFLNLGDAYANDGKWGGSTSGKHANGLHGEASNIGRSKRRSGLPPKSLIGIPWRVAFALQDDGWILRSDIIWAKGNPMPESVRDRPTRAHEYIFLMAASPRYYYDAAAIREPLAAKTYTTFGIKHKAQGNDALGKVKSDNWGRTVGERQPKVWKTPAGWDTSVGDGGHGSIHRDGRGERSDKQRGHSRRHAGFNERWDAMPKAEQQMYGANKRDVWVVSPQPFPGSHYATFPIKLIEPCILAGCPSGGLVLDPFMGAGTVGVVARRHSRHYLGIELSEHYCEMAEARIAEERQPVLWTA